MQCIFKEKTEHTLYLADSSPFVCYLYFIFLNLFVFLEREKEMLLISLETRKNYLDIPNLLSYFGKKQCQDLNRDHNFQI